VREFVFAVFEYALGKVVHVASAGHDRTGNYIQINARTAEGEAVSFNMPVNLATSLSQMLVQEIAKAHKARLARPIRRSVRSAQWSIAT
jgi:hypothetical protein